MKPVDQWLESFAGGVITTLEADAIPPTAMPRARNTTLLSAGGERAAVGKRRGLKTRNGTAITSNPAIIGQAEYSQSGGNLFHILVTDTGRIEKLNGDDTLTNLATGLSGTTPPDFAQANDLLFIVNGSFAKKLNGATPSLQNFGITRPAAPTLASPNAGAMTGTYDFALSFINSAAGTVVHESSRSDTASTTVTSKKIKVTIPSSGTINDSQVDFIRIHVRKTGLQSNFYRVTSGTGINTTYQAWAVSGVSQDIELDLTDANLQALTLVSPSVNENEPPPSGIKYLCWHNSRLFAADDTNVYYSKEGFPESFHPDNVEKVNPADGQKIKGLLSVRGLLLILKETSFWGIEGDDPQTWRKEIIDSKTGCTSHRSIVLDPEGTAYWWSRVGPVAWVPDGPPLAVGRELIAPTVGPDAINHNLLSQICASLDFPRDRIIFAVPERSPEGESSSTKNNVMLPYNYRLKRWESDRWDPLDVASFGVVRDSNGTPWVYIGGYFGQVFRLWDADADGVDSGTKKGTVTSATSSTLTDSTATFNTTGAGLKGRYVYAIDSLGTIQRRRIGSNTGTVLTLDTSLTWSITPTSSFTYVIGGIDWQADISWLLFGEPFKNKRLHFFYAQLKTTAAATKVLLDVFRNYSNSLTKTLSFTVTPGGAIWDQSNWDEARWADQAAANFRLRAAIVGYAIKLRFRNVNPDEPLVLLKVGADGELLNERIG